MSTLPSDFSAVDYLRLNPDVASAGVDPAQHYLDHGRAEGRKYQDISVQKQQLFRLGIFDPDFYMSQYPDVANAGLDPSEHFLINGCAEGRWASLFFRSDWYMDCHPESKSHPKNSLFHYSEIGSQMGYEPNPFFEPEYYLAKYKDQIGSDEPLAHFIKHGNEGFNPSPRFNAAAYIKATGCSENPLKHYLQTGMQAGVPLVRAEPLQPHEEVESAFITVLKNSAPSERVALLVTHSPDGKIKPHVYNYAAELTRGGLSVFLIVASDVKDVVIPENLKNTCSHIIARQNIGFDFAAWAHIIKTQLWVQDCKEIVLTNDSIIGPIGISGPELMKKIRSNHADVIGLVENNEHARHLQSFFLVFREKAIQSKDFKDFWSSIINHADKSKVIRDYEITFTSRLQSSGLSTDCVFQQAGENNATIFNWEKLLDEGFPFLKFEVVKSSSPQNLLHIKTRLTAGAYDTSLIPQLS
ncbi:glycosyl transferase [Pseudomonas congelans]|uniref:rhamnan synthesis F family protein n=1 Tax=Pseudomonas congelans TaxID=200452 RepID=UPI000BB6761B|nr:rhamnan synthesis F family protein [Pseudomonas congelans]PBQ06070.1 glycosyl transferase [Pseudomonas congelans]